MTGSETQRRLEEIQGRRQAYEAAANAARTTPYKWEDAMKAASSYINAIEAILARHVAEAPAKNA